MMIRNASWKMSYKGQQGIVLFVALVVLVIMSLAGISMMRQIDGGQLIAANLAFKQSATSSADRGSEAARSLILTFASSMVLLDTDRPTDGYFASIAVPAAYTSTPGQPFNPATYKWDVTNASIEDTASDGASNRVQHVIHRLCPSVGPIEGQFCTNMLTTDGGDKGGGDTSKLPLPVAQQPFFRVTTRVTGPRNTSSYTQVILY